MAFPRAEQHGADRVPPSQVRRLHTQHSTEGEVVGESRVLHRSAVVFARVRRLLPDVSDPQGTRALQDERAERAGPDEVPCDGAGAETRGRRGVECEG